MIAKKNKSEDIKFIKPDTKYQKSKIRWVKKPGELIAFKKTDGFKYKELKIKADQQLSYQSHQHRKEHWIVTKGQLEAIIEGKTKKLKVNDHLFVAQSVKHRLKNPTNQTAVLLEIQIGSPLSEEDIVRYEDDYGRV